MSGENRGDWLLAEEGRDYDRPDHVQTRKKIFREPAVKKAPVQPAAPPKKRRRRSMNREFAIVTAFTVALFLCMMGYFVYFQVARSKEVLASPYNERQDLYAEHVSRGMILSSDGEVLAQTVETEDGSYREYPYGSVFAHVVGYDTHGKSGIETSENTDLLTSNEFFPRKILNDLRGRKNKGDSVVTTLDSDVQQAAYDALGDNKGAVVAIEPKTGRIVAMVSKPDFDPNYLEDEWEDLYNDTDGMSRLFNRATRGAYPPGSTFKILTSLAYMRQEPNYKDYRYQCEGSISYADVRISCFDGTVHGEEDLTTSFAYSCNSSFANIGLELDRTEYIKTCEDLLFNKNLPCPIGSSKSKFQLTESSPPAEGMMTAMGQGRTLVSPYHMALITAAIANDGVLVRPRIVDRIENAEGTTVKRYKSSDYKELLSSEEAEVLTQMMQAVVSGGTGTELSGLSYSVAGKTGTAEYSDDKSKSHSWFTGFSSVEDPDLVVCVIVEGYDGNPGARAIPIAKHVFDVYHGL